MFDECSAGAYWYDVTRKMMDKLVEMSIWAYQKDRCVLSACSKYSAEKSYRYPKWTAPMPWRGLLNCRNSVLTAWTYRVISFMMSMHERASFCMKYFLASFRAVEISTSYLYLLLDLRLCLRFSSAASFARKIPKLYRIRFAVRVHVVVNITLGLHDLVVYKNIKRLRTACNLQSNEI